jgi:3-methyl-2-oxobutanoate hydroxymethyltransferase
MKKLNVRDIAKRKGDKLQMLTCYDFQTAELLNETGLDLVLVGDSVGNVILGYDTTVEVSLEEMMIFGAAVKRGAPDKFVIIDLPFGTYATVEQGLENSIKLFQKTKAEALKLEGAYPHECELITRLTQIGIPVMGHIGLTPQSVHQQGGYYLHGKSESEVEKLKREALALEKAGCFSIVLEFVEEKLSEEITSLLSIPTIGIGSGTKTDGQVLVINDLLKMGKKMPPKFCPPVADLYETRKSLVEDYLKARKS